MSTTTTLSVVQDRPAPIRIPCYMVEARRLMDICRELREKLGRDPSVAEIARQMYPAELETVRLRLSLQLGRELAAEDPLVQEKILRKQRFAEERVRESLKVPLELVSQETPISEEVLDELSQGANSVQQAEAASTARLRQVLEDVLEPLTAQEKQILECRFGLTDGRPRTLDEVGQEFGVSRDRIRQIESQALRKLRYPTRSGWL